MQNGDVVKTQLKNGVRIISEKIPGCAQFLPEFG